MGISHMIEKVHISSLKRRIMVYKISGLLLLLLIDFRIEPHLDLLSWVLVKVDSFLGISLTKTKKEKSTEWDEIYL